MRTCQYLLEKRVPFETVLHAPAYTAHQRAKYLELSGCRLAKTVVLRLGNEYVVAVLPATHRVDLTAVSCQLGKEARLADDEEIARLFLDCEWGAKSPFGALYGLRTIVDESLTPDAILVLEAQRHSLAVRLRCRHFEELEKPLRFRFAGHQ